MSEFPYTSQPDDQKPPKQSPLIAAILSIFPGGGDFYIGKRARGIANLVMLATMGILFLWAVTTSDVRLSMITRVILIVLIVLFWLWQIVVSTLNAGTAGPSPRGGIIGVLVLLLFFYVLGWQVTNPDWARLFNPSDDTLRIFTQVIWPWDAAIEREQHELFATTAFANPCPDDPADSPAQQTGDGSEPWVSVSPACGEFSRYDTAAQEFIPGTALTLTGGGFQPGREIDVWWESSLGNRYQPYFSGETPSAIADQNGEFTITFNAPQESNEKRVGVQTHHVEARQLESEGEITLTNNFRLAISRMLVTVFQALIATSLGLLLSVPFGFLAARNLMYHNPITRIVYFAVRFLMNIARAIEPFIWAVIATVWVGLGPFAGVLALSIHTVASLGKQYSEAIEDIDAGPIEAITATGANRLQTIVYGIVPQVIPPFLSHTVYRWDINVRLATIIGLVGGGGIGQLLFQWINQFQWHEAGMAAWLITITVTAMDYLSTELRKRVA